MTFPQRRNRLNDAFLIKYPLHYATYGCTHVGETYLMYVVIRNCAFGCYN